MAWFAVAAPLIAGAMQAQGAHEDARDNAAALREQARISSEQSYADEFAQRRQARQVLGKQAAAMAQAGFGPGGSNALLTEQSAGNAELDALNIRYAGLLKKAGYESGARATQKQGKQLAGAALLQGVSSAYTRGSQLRAG